MSLEKDFEELSINNNVDLRIHSYNSNDDPVYRCMPEGEVKTYVTKSKKYSL